MGCINGDSEVRRIINDPVRLKRKQAEQALLKGRSLEEYADDMGLYGATEDQVRAFLAGKVDEGED